jgi:hypothetical protein
MTDPKDDVLFIGSRRPKYVGICQDVIISKNRSNIFLFSNFEKLVPKWGVAVRLTFDEGLGWFLLIRQPLLFHYTLISYIYRYIGIITT